ncbi:hypothetical protein [Psychroflexus tropicus]|uniref:hypothetical protein n=1 Tax=Psychroflexus tropicus TaxID=197345 RepID=UPI001FE08FC5|nr:hypothetical protein [Psychroflexus tropicus]
MNKFKSHITFALCLIVLLFTMKSGFWLSYYVAFTDNFIENYCENKDQPELECDGKCYLSDVLDRKEPETPKNASVFLESELIFTTVDFESDLIIAAIPYVKTTPYFHTSLYKFKFLQSNFKPPALSI